MIMMTTFRRRLSFIFVLASSLAASPSSVVFGQECLRVVDEKTNEDVEKCDTHERCTVWKEEGECYRNEKYMNEYCGAACYGTNTQELKSEIYKSNDCKDIHKNCEKWENENWECSDNYNLREYYCRKSCDNCPEADAEDDDDDEYEDDPSCVDNNTNCKFWSEIGECDTNPKFMHKKCPKSCGKCTSKKRRKTQSSQWSSIKKSIKTPGVGNSRNKKEFKSLKSGRTKSQIIDLSTNYGEEQEADGSEEKKTLKLLDEMIDYMEFDEEVHKLPTSIVENCKNKHKHCGFWAVIGECEANEAYMKTNCAPACKSCHLIDINTRCPPLENPKPALKPGDLDIMFQRIIDEAPGNQTASDIETYDYAQIAGGILTNYTVTIISSPNDRDSKKSDKLSISNDKKSPPWIVVFDNFLTEEECDTLVKLGYDTGYKRSEDVGRKQHADGTFDSVQSKGRTSENAWCSFRDGCRDHDVVAKIHERMGYVMRISPANSEDLQILKYEPSQFYNTHHDYITHQRDRQCGPRILTFFCYLSDVKAGGGTDFPNLGITVMPKKGRAVLWPSVYNADPLKADMRTEHQALPVEEGTKFAANGWIHQYDYITPQLKGCN